MRISPKIKKRLPIIIVLFFVLILGVLGGVFLARPPVLIVTDSSFNLLYGPERLRQRQHQISISLFRRVIPVTVSEHAGPDLVAIAAEEAFRIPRAVLFPYRYLEGAVLYKENNPDVTVMLTGGRNPIPTVLTGTNITYVRTNTMVDMYRAGLSAAVFAGEKNILIFDDGIFPEDYRESLRELLSSRGFMNQVIFQNLHAHVPSFDGIGSVILTGPAFRFIEQNLDIPVILFSWADPAFTPRTVKLIFNDSPWALAATALRFGEFREVLIPSMPVAFSDRIDEKMDFRKLQGIIKENFERN